MRPSRVNGRPVLPAVSPLTGESRDRAESTCSFSEGPIIPNVQRLLMKVGVSMVLVAGIATVNATDAALASVAQCDGRVAVLGYPGRQPQACPYGSITVVYLCDRETLAGFLGIHARCEAPSDGWSGESQTDGLLR
jgi:hypothetical protein